MTTKNKMTKTEEIIEKIVNKYPWDDSKELFRAELEYLALLANREGFVEAKTIVDEKGYLESEREDKEKTTPSRRHEKYYITESPNTIDGSTEPPEPFFSIKMGKRTIYW